MCILRFGCKKSHRTWWTVESFSKKDRTLLLTILKMKSSFKVRERISAGEMN